MNKNEFLLLLEEQLSVLPQKDREEHLNFYREMLEDRIEEGLPEEDAVAAMGSAHEIAAQILSDAPVKEVCPAPKHPKSRDRAWKTVFLILGSPVWLPLLIAAFAVIFALFAALWCIVLGLWAAFAAVAVSAVAAVAGGIVLLCDGGSYPGAAMICAGAVCAGAAILLFLGCKSATCGAAWLTGKTPGGIKRLFFGREKGK